MRKHPFTLTELLAVIAIAGLLLGLMVPAFRSLTTGHAPDRAAREIMGRIRATRAYAASKRVDTALVFMNNETITPVANGSIPDALRYSSYRSCEIYKDTSGNWHFSRWIKGDQWTSIPEGIMVGVPKEITSGNPRLLQTPSTLTLTGNPIPVANLSADASPGNVSGTGTPAAITVQDCLVEDLSGVAAGTTVSLTNALLFHPNGNAENTCLIELREAIHDGSSVKAVASDSKDFYYPLVVRKNGKCIYYPEKKNY